MKKFKSCNVMTCYDQSMKTNVDCKTLVNEVYSNMGNIYLIKGELDKALE